MRKSIVCSATALLCLALKISFAQPVRIMSDVMSHRLMNDGSGQASAVQFQPDMLAHSPEAEQMAKSVTMPMTLYSGMPNISIPIYDLKTRSLDVPIALAYNYNGFKPAEVAGYAGLGWSVQGGGVITRMVKSRVDHQDVHVIGNDYDNYVNINLMTAKQVILQNTALGMVDGEPDIYVFSGPGLSGKFIWLQGEAYLFPYQRIRVTTSANGGFVLTKENGDQYIFDQTEMTHHHSLTGSDYVPDHTSAWFLGRMVSADKADTVKYTYSGYTFNQPPVYSEVYTAKTSSGGSVTMTSPQTLNETASSGDFVESLMLSTISYKDVTVSFALDDAPRRDIFFQDGSLFRLASISVMDAGPTAANKHFSLQHLYYNGKLSLTEVDEFAPKGETGLIDSTTLQRTQFQYIGDTSALTDIPGFSTHSIDYYGYYNGANNQMLFTTNDIVNTVYSPANRAPSLGYCELGMMSQMTHPTGGYTTFNYELNQTGHYIVTGQYQKVYSNVTATVNWPGSQAAPPSGYFQSGTSFSITQKQAIKLALTVNTPAQITDSVLWIQNIYTGQVAFLIASEPAEINSDTLYFEDSLDVGAYNLFVRVNKKGATVTATPVYYDLQPIIYNTLGPAPGVRVKTISHFDNVTPGVPALVKQYSYSDGVGFFKSGTTVQLTVQHGSLCGQLPPIGDTGVLTLQAGLYAPISNVLNNQFYYQYVEEADIGPSNIGKKAYTFNCFAPDDPDVFQTSETDYGYDHGVYYPLHKSVSQYQLHDKFYFQTYTTNLTDQMYNGENCAFVPTTDQTQPVSGVANLYSATHNQLTSAYNTLQSVKDSTWDMRGENPVSTESDYYYDNPSYIYPTRIKKVNSKGQTETTYFKYVPDYLPSGGTSLAGLDSSWATLQNNAINGYNLCYDSLVSALQPYQPYINHSTQFNAIANAYNCENEYQQNSGSAYAARNTQFASYLSTLNAAAYSDPTTWRRAIYRLASDNAIGMLVEQYKTIVLGDGNEYLVDALRNDFSLMNDAAGDTVVKQTQVEAAELSAPLLFSTFTANTGSYYKQQISMSYDHNMALASQNKVNNVKYNYLWGYNHRFPVAEVEGSDSATISGMINQSVLDNPSNDAALRNELNKIRTGLQGTKALVTTSTYDPLAGMTSKTDPAGRTTYFEYDATGRLTDIKDLNGNIIKTYQYHLVN